MNEGLRCGGVGVGEGGGVVVPAWGRLRACGEGMLGEGLRWWEVVGGGYVQAVGLPTGLKVGERWVMEGERDRRGVWHGGWGCGEGHGVSTAACATVGVVWMCEKREEEGGGEWGEGWAREKGGGVVWREKGLGERGGELWKEGEGGRAVGRGVWKGEGKGGVWLGGVGEGRVWRVEGEGWGGVRRGGAEGRGVWMGWGKGGGWLGGVGEGGVRWRVEGERWGGARGQAGEGRGVWDGLEAWGGVWAVGEGEGEGRLGLREGLRGVWGEGWVGGVEVEGVGLMEGLRGVWGGGWVGLPGVGWVGGVEVVGCGGVKERLRCGVGMCGGV